jgi:oxygen-independent coproporphyrinogen III oxidase
VTLLERYGTRPVPRYTSYPPANLWGDVEGADFWPRALQAISRPLALYVHVPFCAKLCFYCGCNMLVTRSERLVERYLAALELEVSRAAALAATTGPVVQLHLGGGTPTHLSSAQLRQLAGTLQRHFPFGKGIEASIEVHPPVTTVEQLETLASLGFNRVSMGVQDFDPRVQARVNRPQPFEQTRDLVVAARANGFSSVNVDLMYGLPLQTLEGYGLTLDRVEALRPDRVAVFGYAHVPNLKKHQSVLDATELPGPSLRLALLELASARLQRAGYVSIGLDHYALPHDELLRARADKTLRRNFMGYTTGAETDLLAFGPSSISEIGGFYAQNAREVRDWAARLEAGRAPVIRGHASSADERLRRDVIMSVLSHLEVDLDAVARRHGQRWSHFAPELERLEALISDGLCVRDGATVRVTPEGQPLMRTVAAVFDATLQHDATLKNHAAAV